MSLTERKKAKSMEKIVSEALHYFEKNGYYNTSVNMLCEEAMISKTTFFNYFGSKEKIIALVIEEGIKELRKFADKEMADTRDPIASLKKSIDFQINATMKYKNISSVFYQLTYKNDEFKKIKHEYDMTFAYIINRTQELCDYPNKLSKDKICDLIGGTYVNTVITYPVELWKEKINNMIDLLIKIMKTKELEI